MALKLGGECSRAVRFHRSVLALLQLDSPHDRVPHVSVCNGMVLIAIRMRFPRDDHETRAILVEPCDHGLVKTREPRWSVRLLHVVVPRINQLPDIVELVLKVSSNRLVGVPDGLVNGVESSKGHHIIEPKGSSIELVDFLRAPPEFHGTNPNKACLVESTPQPLVKL